MEGGKGVSLESRKQIVQGGQAVKRGTGGSLGSRKQKVQVWKGRARRGARARRAAPDLERACHQVTVNASGGQSNAMDRSAAVEEIEEESEEEEEEEEAEVPVPTANCAPKNVFGSPSRAPLGEIESYRPEGSAHALPDGSALGGLLDYQADAGDSADGGEESGASVTLACSRSWSSEVPRFS